MATDIISAATLLFLVLDPLGNIPIFLSVLEDVAPERRTRVLLRELVLALLVLLAFLFFGQYLLGFLQLSEHAIRIAGGDEFRLVDGGNAVAHRKRQSIVSTDQLCSCLVVIQGTLAQRARQDIE